MLESWSTIVFGMECLGCGEASETLDPWLCPDCQTSLRNLSKECYHPKEDVICLFPMDGLTRRLIHLLKYRSIPGMASYLVRHSYTMQGCREYFFPNYARPLYFVPVPLHRARFRERGYNQAELLARACAEIMGFPFEETLEKFKRTKPQHKINAKERIKNVRGAFRLLDSKSVKGKHVLLIDDIITTGNTLGECAKVLLQGKCRFVSCAVVCTTAVNYSEKKH